MHFCFIILLQEKEGNGLLYKIRRDSEDDIKWLLGQVQNEGVEGVLYSWAMDRETTDQSQLLQPFFLLCKHVSSFQKNLKRLPRVVVLTRNVVPLEGDEVSHFHASTLWGFCKSMRNEMAELHNFRCVDISDDDEESEMRIMELFGEMFTAEKEPQLALSKRSKFVPKFCPLKISALEQSLKLPSGTDRFQMTHPDSRAIGDIQFERLDPYVLGEDDVEVEVKMFGLNFRDVLNVIKPTEQFLQKDYDTVGFDFAGVITRRGNEAAKQWNIGDRVFGVNFSGIALPSHMKLPQDFVVRIPDHLPSIQAATLPVVFFTAYQCLVNVAKLKPTDTILIHTGSGGVGISAINICRQLGVTNIITTAGSRRKRNYLRNLGIQHVFHSRNTSFADEILKVTNGRGVDVVLNSLTSEGFKEASLRACAKNAWFLEMSKISVWTEEDIKSLRPDINYYVIDYDLSTLSPADWKERLRLLTTCFFDENFRSPLPFVTFDVTDIRQALVYLQKARQIGKVVCVMPQFSRENGQLKPKIAMFREESTYLITGGLGGIGFLVCRWMLEKGAKHMILLGRSPPSDQVKEQIEKLKENGYVIEVVNLDIGDKKECAKLFQETIPAMNLLPVKGVMHCAGTLADDMVVNQDWARLRSVFQSKIDGTLNLHEHTKHVNMEHFVLFSSMTGLFGTPGQSNHAAASCFEDAFAWYRHSIGLPATTFNFGPWGEVGVATEVDFPGIRPISNLQGLAALEHAMKTHRTQTCVINVDSFALWSNLLPQLSFYVDPRVWNTGKGNGSKLNTILSDIFWSEYDAKELFEEKVQVVKQYTTRILSNVLRLEEGETLREDVDLQELGVDSLMFVEIKNELQTLLGDRVTLNINTLRECNTVNLISTALTKQIEGEEAEQPLTQEQVAELIRKDSVLPNNIQAKPETINAIEIKSIETVLLTGVTGTLGTYVLAELVKEKQIRRIFSIIRAWENLSLEQRFQNVHESRNIKLPQGWEQKVTFVPGNCAASHLGLEDDLWKSLSSEVHAVFHCAANVNHVEQYHERDASIEDVRRVNIGGLKNILEFACESRVKHVFHSGSLISVVTTEEYGFSERWPDQGDYDKITTLAYPNSKFVEDMLLKQAVEERGLPCKIFRLPYLTGDSITGRSKLEQNHMALRYMFIMKKGVMPSTPVPLLAIPVDTAAAILVKLSLHENAPHGPYNITHHNPNIDQDFPEVAKKFGFDMEIVEFSEFAKKVIESEEETQFYHPVLLEHYRNGSELMFSSAQAFTGWIERENREEFFASRRIQKYAPEFYESLKKSLDYIELDLMYAKGQGWFVK